MANELQPCPFCGGDASFYKHADDCYFIILEKLKRAFGDDALAVALDLRAAWNRRAELAQQDAQMDADIDLLCSRMHISCMPAARKLLIHFLSRYAPAQDAERERDAERYRKIIAASELEFPVLSVCDDPENDARHAYGRDHIDALVDQMDEIQPIARAQRAAEGDA